MKISGIYALCEKGTIRYIGQAQNIERRFAQHCSLAQNFSRSTPVKKWLCDMLKTGDEPELLILEVTSDLDNTEITWIKKYRDSGSRLLNVADGGQTMTYLRRAKLEKPWGNAMAPLQRRLSAIKQTINTCHRFGFKELEKKSLKTYADVLEAVSLVDRDWLNNTLWERYGR